MKIYKIIYVENEEQKEIGCTDLSLEKYKKIFSENGKKIIEIKTIKKPIGKKL